MRRLVHGREAGLSLIETLVAITIFAIMTVGVVPLLGTALRGGATTRTESVARNITTKAMERLRGLHYHLAYTSTPRRADLLDHFFPGTTPAFSLPTTTTGYEAGTQSFITRCDENSTAAACKTLPSGAEIPAGYTIEIRATFRDVNNPSASVTPPADYAWNAAAEKDAPPSKLLEVAVEATWTVGGTARTFDLVSYMGDRERVGLPVGPGAPPEPPPPAAGVTPETVNLRAEAKIDYSVQTTTTFRDTQSPPRKTESTATLGIAQAYGEQLDSGSKADLKVEAGNVRLVRAADPAVPSDTGVNQLTEGAIIEAHAPPDAGSTSTVTDTVQHTITNTEINPPGSMAMTAPSQAGTLTGPTGVSPTVAGGLPFVRGYYDWNGTNTVNSRVTHMWQQAQIVNSNAVPGSTTTENPLNLRTGSTGTTRMFMVTDAHNPAGTDPRGEVEIDSTSVTTPSTRVVRAKSTIVSGGSLYFLPTLAAALGVGHIEIRDFTANVNCESRADPGYASTATGTWSATLTYLMDTNNNGTGSYVTRVTTLPTQTRTDNPEVPNGTTNPLQVIKNLNQGKGPLVYDNANNAYDVYLFSVGGSIGMLRDWSTSNVETSISADDRVASASLNGAIRIETMPLRGPWGTTTYPESDITLSVGKLSCKAEDYR